MNAFIATIIWHDMLFAKTIEGEVWRFWFDGAGYPLAEKLTGLNPDYRAPLALLNAKVEFLRGR